MEDGDLAKRVREVLIIVHDDVWQDPDAFFEVGERSRKTGGQFVTWHIVAALGDAHGHPLFGGLGGSQADEAEDDIVTGADCFLEKGDFITNGVGKHGFKDKTLALFQEGFAERGGDFRGVVGVDADFAGEDVGIDQTKAAGLEVSRVKSGFAGAVGAGKGNDDRALVEAGDHLRDGFTGWNCRFTNRPTVRRPLASIRTSRPGAFLAAS